MLLGRHWLHCTMQTGHKKQLHCKWDGRSGRGSTGVSTDVLEWGRQAYPNQLLTAYQLEGTWGKNTEGMILLGLAPVASAYCQSWCHKHIVR